MFSLGEELITCSVSRILFGCGEFNDLKWRDKIFEREPVSIFVAPYLSLIQIMCKWEYELECEDHLLVLSILAMRSHSLFSLSRILVVWHVCESVSFYLTHNTSA